MKVGMKAAILCNIFSISLVKYFLISRITHINLRQATVRGADHSQTGQGVLTVTRLRLCVRLYRRACVFIETQVETVCVPTDITGSLSAGPTLWELRFKAWHKIDIQTHTNKKRIVSRYQLNKKLP